jgi:hypothetical protein
MGVMDSLGSFLGTSDSFHADPYKTDPNAYRYQGGPDQAVMDNSRTGYAGQAAADRSNQLGARGQQEGYLAQLQNAYAGNGPSQAQAVLQQGAGRAAADAMSLARSGGGNPALQAANMRNAQRVGAAGITNAGANAAQIKSQEQQNALNQMGGAIQGVRGQDLQSQQLGMGGEQGYLGAQQHAADEQLGASQNQQALNSANYNAAQGINAGVAQQNAQANQAMLGGVMGAAGGALALSDMRAKTNIAPAGNVMDAAMGASSMRAPPPGTGALQAVSDAAAGPGGPLAAPPAQTAKAQGPGIGGIFTGFARGLSSDERGKMAQVSEGTKSGQRSEADSFLASLHPYTYEYKDPQNEPRDAPTGGRYLGVMAQDVERAPGVGRQIVTDTPHGKAIELPAMVSSLAAGTGRLHERLSALEEMAKGMRGKAGG